ncbi:MAG: two-component system activity regulator YycH, partial [Anaerobacillus sp.]
LLSNDVLKKLVSISKSDIPLTSFDRIIIPSVSTGKNNEIIFLNTSSQKGMRATVDASADMKKWFSETFASFNINDDKADKLKFSRAKSYQLSKNSPVFYIPIQGQTVGIYGDSTDELANEEAFKEALFPEQDRVKKNTFNISDLYTDGSRDLTFSDDSEYMIFKNPPSNPSSFDANEAPILNAYGFINKHYGFRITNYDDEYVLNEWVRSSEKETDQITFRLNTEGYPVFSSSVEDLDEINVTLENNEVSTYKRMLKVIQYAKQTDERRLPGYSEVLALLEDGSFKESEIQNITLGFTIDRSLDQSEDFDFTLVPQWYVKVDQKWTPLQSISNEQGGN